MNPKLVERKLKKMQWWILKQATGYKDPNVDSLV